MREGKSKHIMIGYTTGGETILYMLPSKIIESIAGLVPELDTYGREPLK